MKGLLWKDLLCLRKGAVSYAVVVAIYVLLVAIGLWSIDFFAMFMALLVCMLPYTCFSSDAAAKWDLYGLALPVSRRQIVLARYLLVLLLAVVAAAGILVIGAVVVATGEAASWNEYLFSSAVFLGFGTLVNIIMLPLLYRFGAERAKIVFFGVFGALFLAGWLLVQLIGGVEVLNRFEMPAEMSILPPLAVAAAVCVALLAASYLLSVQIYERREL